jgi:hypothetical protein
MIHLNCQHSISKINIPSHFLVVMINTQMPLHVEKDKIILKDHCKKIKLEVQMASKLQIKIFIQEKNRTLDIENLK